MKLKVNVQYVDINHTLDEGGYGKVYKCQILGINNILKKRFLHARYLWKQQQCQICKIVVRRQWLAGFAIMESLNYLYFMQQKQEDAYVFGMLGH